MHKSVTLKPDREEPLQRRHPWLFSGAIGSVEGDPQSGDTVDVYSSTGEWMARGAYSPHSQIRVRIWTWDQEQEVDEKFLASRVEQALKRRSRIDADPEIEAFREIHAESDFLPGIVVDRYGSFRVLQILSAGAERWREALIHTLASDGRCIGIYERSDAEVRELEGLPKRTGSLWGQDPPEQLQIQEAGLRYSVDVKAGHKTGMYLDQRHNRLGIHKWIRSGTVLDAFCYTGGFSLNAIKAGAASVLAVDSSEAALENAARNAALNDGSTAMIEWRCADVFAELRSMRDADRSFDVVILDPPRFAPTTAHVHKAARGYKDVNLFAFKLLKPGGRLITFSCSGGVSPELFQKIVADAALDAGVDAQIREWLAQAEDHPVATTFPEGRYLKGLVCTI